MRCKRTDFLLDNPSLARSAQVNVSNIQFDSRRVQSGDLFLAYPGFNNDGRYYIKDAIERGAAAVFYESENFQPQLDTKVPLIPVVKLCHQVGLIAARFFDNPSACCDVIGITGTNGKTSCSQFIAQALSNEGNKCAVIGTCGIGFLPTLHAITHTTPQAVDLQRALHQLNMEDAQTIAMEVSSHALDQRRVAGIQFNTAVFTQLSQDHLDYHGTMENYARAKERLFEFPQLSNAVINADDSLGQKLIKKYVNRLNILSYSLGNQPVVDEPAIIVTNIIVQPGGYLVEVDTPFGNGAFATSLYGRFNIANLLAVLGVLLHKKLPLDRALRCLSNLQPVVGRMESIANSQGISVLVDYAHTPDALEKALMALRERASAQLICVFGCGGDRDRTKRPQMARIVERYADKYILTNDNPRSENPADIIQQITAGFKQPEKAIIKLNRADAIQYAVQNASKNDIVLIAGKGHEKFQIVGNERLPFDDVQQVKKVFEQ